MLLARRAAQEGTVLIANRDATLPLSPAAIRDGTLKLAVVGPLGDGSVLAWT